MHQQPNVSFKSRNSNLIPEYEPFTIEPIFYESKKGYELRIYKDFEYYSPGSKFVVFEHTIVKTPSKLIVLTFNPIDQRYALLKRSYDYAKRKAVNL